MLSSKLLPRSAVFFVWILSFHTVSSVARAEPERPTASEQSADKAADKARTLFREARQLVSERQYAQACPKFEQSLAIERGIGTMYNLANCWEKLGRLASAQAMFASTAAAARSMGQTDRSQLARDRATALTPKLSRLLVTVGTPAAGLTLWQDEKQLDKASWGTATPIDAGSHEIKAAAPGKQSFVAHVEIPEFPTTVTVTVPPLVDAAPAPQAKPTRKVQRVAAAPPPRRPEPLPRSDREPQADSSSGTTRVVALAVGAAGVGALVAGVVLALDYRSKNDEATGICPSAVNCSRAEVERHGQLVDDARSSRNWSYLAFGVGGAAVLGGATIYLTSGQNRSSHKARIGVSPLATSAGPVGAVVRGNW